MLFRYYFVFAKLSIFILFIAFIAVFSATTVALAEDNNLTVIKFEVERIDNYIEYKCTVNNTAIARVSLVPYRIDNSHVYDYKLVVRAVQRGLEKVVNDSVDIITVVRYELVVNGEVVDGYIASGESLFSVKLSSLCQCNDLVKVEIRSLFVTVNILRRSSWEIFAAGSIDIGDAMRKYGFPLFFINRLDKYYFYVDKDIVDDYWINYNIIYFGKKIGEVRVLTHGLFNKSKSLRIYYDIANKRIAGLLSVEVLLDIVTANSTNTILYELEPYTDIILPSEVIGIVKEKPISVKNLVVYLKIPYYNVSINVTKDIGVVYFDWVEPMVVEKEIVKVNETRVAPGVLVTYHLLPRVLDPDNIRVYFEPRSGSTMPLYVISGIVWNNETGRIYLKSILVFGSQGLVDGEVVVESRGAERVVTILRGSVGPISIDPASIVFTDIPVKYIGARIGPQAIISNGPAAEVIRRHGLSREFSTLGKGVLLYLDLGGAVLDPFDLVVVELEFRLRPIDPIYKVWAITFPRTVYEDWVESARRSMFFLNSTSGSTASFYWENRTYKLVYTIPAQALVKYEIAPALDGLEPRIKFYGLGILFLNTEELEVVSVSARLVDYNGVGGGPTTPPILTGLGLLSTVVATTVLVLRHRRSNGDRRRAGEALYIVSR